MIFLDTSVVIAALSGPMPLAGALRDVIDMGEMLAISTIALYEWLRGPRLPEELAVQEAILPPELALPFESSQARLSAAIYRKLRSPRGREVDIMIAACAIAHDAPLWTLNPADFRDIPGLRLFQSQRGQ